MNPFDYVNAINFSKKDLMTGTDNDELAEKDYQPFLVNRALSYFPDTLMHAHAMTGFQTLDNKLQNSYLLNTVRPSKRFAKWVKKQDSNDIEAVKQYYGYGNEKALEALSILSGEQLTIIKNKLAKGGNNECDRKPHRGDTS
jgi:hypothetical protein